MSLILEIPPPNPRLSNYAVGALPQDLSFIDRIAPIQRMPAQTGKYLNYSVPLSPRDDRIGPHTKPWPQVTYGATEDTWVCEAHGHEHPVPRLQDTGAFNQQVQNGIYITSRQTQFNKVYTILTFLGDAANYGSYTESPSAKFNSSGTDVRAFFRSKRFVAELGIYLNIATMGVDVFEAILSNDVFLGSFKGFRMLPSTEAELQQFVAAYLGLDAIEVVELAYNTAPDGETPSYGVVWPAETVSLFYRGPLQTEAGQIATDEAARPLISEATPAFVRQIVWTGVVNAPQGIGTWMVEDPAAGFGVQLVRTAQIYAKPKIQMPGAGKLFTNVLA